MAQKQQLTTQRRPVAATVVECRRIVGDALLPSDVRRQPAHRPVVHVAAEGIDDVRLQQRLVVVGIGKVHAVAVANIYLIYICAHAPHLFAVRHIAAPRRLQQADRLKERCRRTVPVAGALVAAAVVRIGIHKRLQRLLYLADGLLSARLVLFREQNARQPVRRDPRVPVHAGRLPPVVLRQGGVQHAPFQFLPHPLAHLRCEGVEPRLQHIRRPRHETGRLGIEEIHLLLLGPWHWFVVVGRNAPPCLLAEGAQTVDDVGHEASLAFHYLGHDECRQPSAFLKA